MPDWVRRYLVDRLRPQDERLAAILGRSLPWDGTEPAERPARDDLESR